MLKDLPRAKVPGDLNEGLTGQLERSVLLNPSNEESGDALRIRRWPQFTAVAAVLLLATGLAFVVYYALPGSQVNHGNQVALLERSRCFQASTMTCSTCHNVHLPQRDAATFSARCLSCHRIESCGLYPKLGRKIADNCVDCHMPKLTSNTIISFNAGAQLQPQVRTHWIKVYPANPQPQLHSRTAVTSRGARGSRKFW